MNITSASAAVAILASLIASGPSFASASVVSRRDNTPDRKKKMVRRNTVGMSIPSSMSYDAQVDEPKTFDGLESELGNFKKSPMSKSSKAFKPSCIDLMVTILTDSYPEETSWNLVNHCTGGQVLAVYNYPQAFKFTTQEYCVPPGYEYTFTIFDGFGDGMSCSDSIACNGSSGPGTYEVVYNGTLAASGGGNFGSYESMTFGSCAGGDKQLPLDIKSSSPIPPSASCTSLRKERCEAATVGCQWSDKTGCSLMNPEKK